MGINNFTKIFERADNRPINMTKLLFQKNGIIMDTIYYDKVKNFFRVLVKYQGTISMHWYINHFKFLVFGF